MIMRELELRVYRASNNKEPFTIWHESLDNKLFAVVQRRLDRLSLGNFGDCKNLKDGLFELRIDFGPGYRVYFSLHENTIVLLLTAGNKSTQQRDIEKAREYLADYRKE